MTDATGGPAADLNPEGPVEAAAAPDSPPTPGVVTTPIPPEDGQTTEDAQSAWSKVTIVANRKGLPSGDLGKTIVIQAFDAPKEGEAAQPSDTTYPAKADAYLGYAPSPLPADGNTAAAVFGPAAENAQVFLLGDNVRQGGFRDLATQPGFLNVGPAHPAYAAVNLAFQMGARDVRIVGLREDEVERLRPWLEPVADKFDSLSTT